MLHPAIPPLRRRRLGGGLRSLLNPIASTLCLSDLSPDPSPENGGEPLDVAPSYSPSS